MPLFFKVSQLFPVCSIALALTFAGCGGEPKPAGMPPLHPATLVFTQEGEPIAGASVQLVSETDSRWPIGGSTDTAGTIALKTYGKYPGVPEGKYKVVVSKVEREQIGPAPQSMYEVQKENVFDLIDANYSIPEKTPLTIEVKPGKNSYEPFDLGKKIRQKVKKPGDIKE